MVRSVLAVAAQIAFWAALTPAAAQTLGGQVDGNPSSALLDGNAIDELARQQRIAITGTLGLAPLPAVTADSPRNTMVYADRLPYGVPYDDGGDSIGLISVDTSVPASLTGTGFAEIIQYKLPDLYDDAGPAHPMVIAYHGYGSSAKSPANQSEVDDEANARNWVYLSVTGLDDMLLGSPLSQQNTEAAIQWMINNFNVDPDRLYMVGFSAGAAISANFAASHRDPDGIMIAALGLVSATGDWVMEYNMGDASLQAWLENFYNFGGPPSTNLFNYQAAGTMYNDQASYPPVTSAVPQVPESMVTNLGSVPTYITYDDQDTLLQVPVLCEQIAATLIAAGTTVQKTIASGTMLPGPPSVPAPHSWAVLDEIELFDFLSGRTVDRTPATFSAQQAVSSSVSWATTVKEEATEFTYVDGTANPGAKLITVSNVANAKELHIDVEAAGLTGAMPYRIQVTNSSATPTRLHLTGFPDTPCYMKVPVLNTLVTLVDSDPGTGPTGNGTLIVDVPGLSTFDARVIHEPSWTSVLTTSPNPVNIGAPISFDIDGPAGDPISYIVVSLTELLTPVSTITMTAFPGPPAIVRLVPLDLDGDITFGQVVPNDPLLLGVRLACQAVTTDGLGGLLSVSNHWGLYVNP
jgi:predicted esterase